MSVGIDPLEPVGEIQKMLRDAMPSHWPGGVWSWGRLF